MSTRDRLALAIHDAVCAVTPCTPHETDWTAAADAALADLERQTRERT